MCKIIQFPVKESNSYKNLVMFFDECDTIENCNFYLEAVEVSYKNGYISEKEMYTLRRLGRQKRLKLANPVKEPEKAEKPGTYCYTPEMGEQKPVNCQMEASRAYYGKHFFIYTLLEIKGRGITFIKKCNDGRNEYQVTNLAFEKLKKQYSISMKLCLD